MDPERLLHRAALGRVACIGDVYDTRSDSFCGVSVLSNTTELSTAIAMTDTPSDGVRFSTSNSLFDKFQNMDVSTELKMSILAGQVNLAGSGRYLDYGKSSARSVQCALFHSIKTRKEHLNFLRDCWIPKTLDFNGGTHVVVGITWGANTIICVEDENKENQDKRDIEALLVESVSKLTKSSNKVVGNHDGSRAGNYKLIIFSDVIFEVSAQPRSLNEVSEHIKLLPDVIKKSYNGKGKPLEYFMAPIDDLFRSALNKIGNNKVDTPIISFDEEIVKRFLHIFDAVAVLSQDLNDLLLDMDTHVFCISENDLITMNVTKSDMNASKSELRKELSTLLIEIRSGLIPFSVLEQRLVKYEAFVVKTGKHLASKSYLYDRMRFADTYISHGVQYLGRGHSVESELLKHQDQESFVLYYNEAMAKQDPMAWEITRQHFTQMIDAESVKKMGVHFFLLDCEFFPNITLFNVISLMKGENCICEDVCSDQKRLASMCLARTTSASQSKLKPNKRSLAVFPCPRNQCGDEECVWSCYECKGELEFGFDSHLYCSCGRTAIETFEFRCNNAIDHGQAFEPFNDRVHQFISNLKPPKEITILLLGETGVGKSTWVNGFAQYLSYSSLAEASASPTVSLIPTQFTMTNENYQEVVVSSGKDENEVVTVGQSATQYPKTYRFVHGNTVVRIIDPPGIGDTRGIVQDKENFRSIMSHISYIDEIHGICILLKPNNARLGVMFEFCIKELLTHLHRDAANNIIFCFTNARSTFYKPGDTLPVLKKLLSEFNDAQIPLTKNTIYCFDSEAVRFLAALKQGVKLDDDSFQTYSASWDISVNETNRLLKYVESLTPHSTKGTVTINEARRRILALTEPLATISRNIQDNISVVNDQRREISSSALDKKSLQAKLYVPIIDLESVKLDYPRTVCTSDRCVKVYTVDGRQKINYVQWCHEHCYLVNVNKEQYPCIALQGCKAMQYGFCKRCRCEWAKHMHIDYEYSEVQRQVIDKNIEQMIESKSNFMEIKNAMIKQLEKRVEDLNGEQAAITKACSKFGVFLRNNSIVPYNDALVGYMDYLIRAEESKIRVGGDNKILYGLKDMLETYKKEIQILSDAVSSGAASEKFTADDMENLVRELYTLPIKGKELQAIMKTAESARHDNVQYNERSYVSVPQKTSKEKQLKSRVRGIIHSFTGAISYAFNRRWPY